MPSEGARQRRPEKQASDISRKQPKKQLSESEAVKKASRGWVHYFLIALVLSISLPLIVLILLPSPIEPQAITGYSDAPEFVGPLEPNDILLNAERIYRDQLVGPESILADGDHLYTGTSDGWVNHIHQGVVQKLVRFGKGPCGGIENEVTCGRPLGMRMDKNGFLIVADAYFGLFKVNVATGEYTTLYSSSTPINGKQAKLVNDLDIGPDGKIYFTDSSTRWNRNKFPLILLEGSDDGRLLMYDPETGKTTQLFDGLIFANGVQLTKDKSAVLVTETCRFRIMKYDLQTKALSVWADNLPGSPDNIRYSKITGTYWLGIAFVRQKGKTSFIDFLYNNPWLRGILAKVASIKGFQVVNGLITVADTKAMAVELDQNGTIIRSLQDKTGAVTSSISEIEIADGVMYFGSYHANFIVRLYRKRVPGL
ncbi:unnamed protein product [Lymnaea stagnalis]|uniref:Strictosidine synthase conserved region domain-containing protein n=1 Tax=Lymnaea stagnalis TaxID=6523 RepID=A0AAV2I8Y3_LYMST